MQLYNLLYHLKQCPEDFLSIPRIQTDDYSLTEILVKDVYRKIYGSFDVPDYLLPAPIQVHGFTENHRISVQIACWFFSYPEFAKKPYILPNVQLFLQEDLLQVCELVGFRQWLEDEDRTEEFIRMALMRCEILLESETAEEASDKLDALDSIKRHEVLKDSNEAMERIREIRRKMAEQKARDAANVYGRE